jgi:hypothetical protein
MLRPPAIGERVRVLRVIRNGVFVPGDFTSTVVTVIPAEGEFHTGNSIYRWEVIGVVSGVGVDRGPSAAANDGDLS